MSYDSAFSICCQCFLPLNEHPVQCPIFYVSPEDTMRFVLAGLKSLIIEFSDKNNFLLVSSSK